MNHKVNSVADLYESATGLYSNYVVGSNNNSATVLMQNLKGGIDELKNSWEGVDAGTQINNVVIVYNAMAKVKNALAELCVASSGIAANYRAIQRANGASLDDLSKLQAEQDEKLMDEYSDSRDTVNISPEGAAAGKKMIDAANEAIDGFISGVEGHLDKIMENWVAGPGREEANNAFKSFIASSNTYKNMLNEVSKSIAIALQNYDMLIGNELSGRMEAISGRKVTM